MKNFFSNEFCEMTRDEMMLEEGGYVSISKKNSVNVVEVLKSVGYNIVAGSKEPSMAHCMR